MSISPTKTLDIFNSRNVLENKISFNKVDLVSDVLSRIRTKRQLKPNVQILFISIDGLNQEALQGELRGSKRMSEYYPEGGRVRIDTKIPTDEEKNMTISDNVAHDDAKLNSIIAIQSKEGSKATIARNKAYNGGKMTSVITDDTKTVLASLNFD